MSKWDKMAYVVEGTVTDASVEALWEDPVLAQFVQDSRAKKGRKVSAERPLDRELELDFFR